MSVTYIGFSLGCFILAVGIAELLKQGVGRKSVKRLILIQPALGITTEACDALGRGLDRVPFVVDQFISLRSTMDNIIFEALNLIRSYNIPVELLIWKDDSYIEYGNNKDTDLLARLQKIDVQYIELPIEFEKRSRSAEGPGGLSPFEKHSKIAQHPITIEKLVELLEARPS